MPDPAPDHDPNRTGIEETLRAAPPPEPEATVTRQRAEDHTVQVPSHAAARGSAPASTPDPLASEGTPFGRYRLLRKLGAGGMGVVWRAYDTEMRRTVALKQISSDSEEPEALDRFLREARLAGSLRHPNIVGVYDVGQVDGKHFITMDCIDGRTFGAELDETRDAKRSGSSIGQPRLRHEIGLLAKVSEAVAYAHGEGIIHRDLKPGNVLIDEQGRPFVMDFGLAREVREEGDERARIARTQLTHSGQLLGTPSYMSPEQADGDLDLFGPQTDVWALGVMLYEVLTGALPLEGKSALEVIAAVLQDTPRPPPSRKSPHVPPELEAICLKATEREPARRYASATEFAEELRRWLRGDPVLARRPTALQLLWRWMRRRRMILIPTAAAIALILASLSWGVQEQAHGEARERTILAKVAGEIHAFIDTVMSTEMTQPAREALARQPLGVLDTLIEEQPSFGPARAWRAHVFEVLGRPEAEAELDKACALSPDEPSVWYHRGLHRIEAYRESRGLRGIVSGSSGAEFDATAPETPAQAELRASGVADLQRMEHAPATDAALGARDRCIARAMLALHQGATDAALRQLEGIEGADAARVRGVAFYYAKRWLEAEAALGEAVSRWTQDTVSFGHRAFARYALGLDQFRTGADPRDAFRNAIADFDAAFKLSPALGVLLSARGNAWQSLAEAEAARGEDADPDYARALADFDAAVQARPEDVATLVNRAATLLLLGFHDSLHGKDPGDRYAQALADLDTALAANAGNVLAHATRATLLARMGDALAARGEDPRPTYVRAIADYDEALAKKPGFGDALHNRSECLRLLGDAQAARGEDPRDAYRRAIADAQGSLSASPDQTSAYLSLGLAWEGIGDAEKARGGDAGEAYDAALAALDEAVKRNPGLDVGWNNRGNVHRDRAHREREQGRDPHADLQQAIADYDEAEKLNASRADLFTNRGNARVDLGQAELAAGRDPLPSFAKALADLDAAIAHNPESGAAYDSRGRARWHVGQAEARAGKDPRPAYAKALTDFAETLKRDPGHAAALAHQGDTHVKRGEWEAAHNLDAAESWTRAVASYGDALKRNPADGRVHASRGAALLQLGNLDVTRGEDPGARFRAAIADLDEALRLDPRDANSYTNRGVIRMTQGQILTQGGKDPAATYAAAEKDLSAGAERGQGMAWLNLGLLYTVLGKLDDAIAAFEKGAQAVPAYAQMARAQIERLKKVKGK